MRVATLTGFSGSLNCCLFSTWRSPNHQKKMEKRYDSAHIVSGFAACNMRCNLTLCAVWMLSVLAIAKEAENICVHMYITV